jgi:hypothetical protein
MSKHLPVTSSLSRKILCLLIPAIVSFGMNASAQKKIPAYDGDTITFSGYKWVTKDSQGKHTGPGNNYFSGSKKNVYVDESGKLHLRVTNANDKWYCPEVRLLDSLGYGKYFFYLEPLPQPLDKDVVIGLFLYDREDTSNFHKEVDVEISTWGQERVTNAQYVIQPKEADAFRFVTDLSKCSVHMFEMKAKKISFRSYYPGGEMGKKEVEIAKHTFKPEYQYFSDKEKVSMNVWLYHTVEPASLQEFEVVINAFKFTKGCKIPLIGK